MGGEEGRQGQGLEIGTGDIAFTIGLREAFEGLRPRVTGHRIPARDKRVRGRRRNGVGLAHRWHCATRTR